MFQYQSEFSKSKPVVFVDSRKYNSSWSKYDIVNSTAAESLDFQIIFDRIGDCVKKFGMSQNSLLSDYFIPTTDTKEIKARQEVVREIYNKPNIARSVLEIICSVRKIRPWTNKFLKKKSFDDKTEDIAYLVAGVESALEMDPKNRRLKIVRQFAKDISDSEDYQILRKYLNSSSSQCLRQYSSALGKLADTFGIMSGKLTGAKLIEIYRKICKEKQYYGRRINILDIDTRRNMYKALKEFQTVFKKLMHGSELKTLIDREEAKDFKLEERLDEAMKILGNTSLLKFKHKSRATKAQRYFLGQFGDLLEHMDTLIETGLSARMSNLDIKTKGMTKELAFYYSLARLAKHMQRKSSVKLPVILKPERKVYDIKDALIPSATLRDRPIVPNDIICDADKYIFLITGANGNGKTTYERMLGQMQILAQVGGFVPAAKAKMSIVDGIFTSFGSEDDPARQEGTFASELNFLNFITIPQVEYHDYFDEEREFLEDDEFYADTDKKLNPYEILMAYRSNQQRFFTGNSLLLFDEIAIGSDNKATEEAIARTLMSAQKRGARLLISTHFHPIADRIDAKEFPNAMNLGAQVKKRRKKGKTIITPTFKIKRNTQEESHGERLFAETGYTEEDIDKANEALIKAGIIPKK